jgi:hypothetical protein
LFWRGAEAKPYLDDRASILRESLCTNFEGPFIEPHDDFIVHPLGGRFQQSQ